MTLNFYTLGVLYLVYSFLGWVGETVVATFRGKRFATRGMAAGTGQLSRAAADAVHGLGHERHDGEKCGQVEGVDRERDTLG